MAQINPNASPSQLEAEGALHSMRRRTEHFEKEGSLAISTLVKRYNVRRDGWLEGAAALRRTKAAGGGEGGATTVNVKLNGSTVLAAVMSLAYADGDNLRKIAALKTDHAAYDATHQMIKLAVGDYFDVTIDAIEAGGTAPVGLDVELFLIDA